MNKEHPMPGQELGYVDKFDDSKMPFPSPVARADELDEANVISSRIANSTDCHKVILDIDFPVKLLPSSRPGHGHLYVDYTLSWEAYEKLLIALRDAGLLEKGYVEASRARRATWVRLPWVKK